MNNEPNKKNGAKPAVAHKKNILDDRRIRLALSVLGAIVAWMVVTILPVSNTESQSSSPHSSSFLFKTVTAILSDARITFPVKPQQKNASDSAPEPSHFDKRRISPKTVPLKKPVL